ncbi:MAG: hypothetical protein ACRDK4_03435 [Solirubrobacteraceae bacterium]
MTCTTEKSTRALRLLVASLALLVCAMAQVGVARGETAGPQWTVSSVSRPTNFAPGDESGDDGYVVFVTNTGGSPTDGSPITIGDELPAGLSFAAGDASGENELAAANKGSLRAGFSCIASMCTYSGVVQPDQSLVIRFHVDVSGGASASVENVVRVSGGGAVDASMATPTTISPTPAGFGVSPGSATTTLSSVQAGAHPDITTSLAFNTIDAHGALADAPKNIVDDLPPGFAGADLAGTPSCSPAQFKLRQCPLGSQVGVITLNLYEGSGAGSPELLEIQPVYNLEPGFGQAAKLGFIVNTFVPVEGAVYLRGDYGPRVVFEDISQTLAELDDQTLTIWGVPAAASHYPMRYESPLQALQALPKIPYFSNPTFCGAASYQALFTIDSWLQPESNVGVSMPFGPAFGCDRLTMQPSITAEPTTDQASAATGLDLTLKLPQTFDNSEALATANLKKTVITLPEGVTVNPSAGAGLGACSQAQFEEEAAQYVAGKGCPTDSKLGTVSSHTPVLSEEAFGSVFIAKPYENPFKSLIALYIVARIPNRGIIVKASGEVHADPVTGRLVTTFDDLPQVPYDTFTFSFRQGATSPLVTPPTCGNYTVKASLNSWANPNVTLEPPIPAFAITTGANGGPCPTSGTPPFEPSVTAGMNDNRAGSYSPLYLRIERRDGEQEITGFSTRLPSGLTGNLTGVPQCPETAIRHAREQSGGQAETEPACPAASRIGHTIAEAGVGSVLVQTPGTLYFAGPFEGAPFSVVDVTSAKVGPFDLGTVVVHLPLQIDPLTAQVSIPSGPADQIPHIIDGIVVHLRAIRAYVDRERFMLNPTSCAPSSIGASVIGAGANPANPAGYDAVDLANSFQDADCSSLAFKPSFSVSTSGKTSRKNGASLSVKLTFPPDSLGKQANIRSVKVDLPKQLPSRLTTLQKACTQQQFAVNPAGCPAASIVGHAKAITPILPVALEGPAYFVSHGGAKFPELIIVLQGDGVTIDLHGETFINEHTGITSSTFHTVPDQPVTSFELTLPQGANSALAANTSLCQITKTKIVKRKVRVRSKGHARTVTRKVKTTVPASLVMPTAFTAQNGDETRQNTPIEVTGCQKTKAKKAAANRRTGRRGGDATSPEDGRSAAKRLAARRR